MPTCKETEQLLDLYLDGELNDLEQKKCKKHLGQCPNCSRELELRKLEREVIRSGFPVPELSPDFCERVMKKVTSYKKQKSPLSCLMPNFSKKPWLAPVLTGLILLFAFYGVFSSNLLAPDQEISSEAEVLIGTTGNNRDSGHDRKQQSAIKHEQEHKNNNIKNLDTRSASLSSTDSIDSTSNQSSPVFEVKQEPAETEAISAKTLIATGKEHSKSSPNRMTGETQRDRFKPTETPEPAFIPVYLPAGFTLERIDSLERAVADRENDTAPETVVVTFSNPRTAARICLEITPENNFATTQSSEPRQNTAQIAGGEQKITRYAEKAGRHYILRVYGDLPLEELKKVINSLQ